MRLVFEDGDFSKTNGSLFGRETLSDRFGESSGRFNLVREGGEVGVLTYRTFSWPPTPSDKDVLYGVLVAAKDSNRFLTTDPKAFYKDQLGQTAFTAQDAKVRWRDRPVPT